MTVELTDDFRLLGDELEVQDAEAIKRQGTELLSNAGSQVVIDFAGLKRANSITVALMLEWYRVASSANKSIVFVNRSEELRNIVRFSGLTQVLNLDT